MTSAAILGLSSHSLDMLYWVRSRTDWNRLGHGNEYDQPREKTASLLKNATYNYWIWDQWLSLLFSIFIVFYVYKCWHIFVSYIVLGVCRGQKRGILCLDRCDPPGGCWGCNPGSLQEQQVSPVSSAYLWLLFSHFFPGADSFPWNSPQVMRFYLPQAFLPITHCPNFLPRN